NMSAVVPAEEGVAAPDRLGGFYFLEKLAEFVDRIGASFSCWNNYILRRSADIVLKAYSILDTCQRSGGKQGYCHHCGQQQRQYSFFHLRPPLCLAAFCLSSRSGRKEICPEQCPHLNF